MEDVNFNKQEHQKKKVWLYVLIPVLILIGIAVYANLQAPAIETLHITKYAQTFDVNQEKTVSWTYTPEDADLSKVSASVSDETLAQISMGDDGVLKVKTLSEEGSFDISLQSDDITSNTVTCTIVDKQKEAERIAKKAEEERIAAEKAEQERIAAEKAEQERIAAEKAEQERMAQQQAAAQQAAAKQQTKQKSNSRTVYVTPTGKRYHYSGSCNGGSYSPSTLEDALARGLTPCKKCVG